METKKNHRFIRPIYEIDAAGKVLGRLATDIAMHLIGKTSPSYVPYLDQGAKVIVKNAAKLVVTGKKQTGKIYHRFSGYPGGLKSESLGKMLAQKPDELLQKVVYNMLPKNRLRKKRMTRLLVTR